MRCQNVAACVKFICDKMSSLLSFCKLLLKKIEEEEGGEAVRNKTKTSIKCKTTVQHYPGGDKCTTQ